MVKWINKWKRAGSFSLGGRGGERRSSKLKWEWWDIKWCRWADGVLPDHILRSPAPKHPPSLLSASDCCMNKLSTKQINFRWILAACCQKTWMGSCKYQVQVRAGEKLCVVTRTWAWKSSTKEQHRKHCTLLMCQSAKEMMAVKAGVILMNCHLHWQRSKLCLLWNILF